MQSNNLKLKTRNPKDNYEIERAIKFLVHKFEESGHNPKPVILHSIRVGLYLLNQGYKKEIVMAGILHDLLEDTDVTFNEIKERFDEKTAKLVKANSYDTKNSNRLQRSINCYGNCLKCGKDAFIIKAADILENMPYSKLVKDRETKKYLLKKWNYFLKLAKPAIEKEMVYKDLKNLFQKLKKIFEI